MNKALLTSNKEVASYSANEVFFCPEESQFYSQCLENMVLSRCTHNDLVVEFGSGEGAPVINSLLKNKFESIIHGYELNSAACKLARSRIKQYQLKDKYVIHNQCFFQRAPNHASYLIANPPYLPAPDDDLYMPSLHGGTDGATITKRLIAIGYNNVLLMISAYSNPVETVNYAIAQGYQVVDFMLSPLKFGYYRIAEKFSGILFSKYLFSCRCFTQKERCSSSRLVRRIVKSNDCFISSHAKLITYFQQAFIAYS
ncbi:MAG: hypothetical protein RLZZ04_4744 [Cyanobacteriota bacterium]